MPARLLWTRPGGGLNELLLVGKWEYGGREAWQCLARPAGRLKEGAELAFGGALRAVIVAKERGGRVWAAFSETGGAFRRRLDRIGLLPLPPYIERPGRRPTAEDEIRYQTSFATRDGAVAAPTAGLHFTPEVDETLSGKGIGIAELTLYVGPGTFRPIRAGTLDSHRMDAERYEIPAETWARVAETRKNGGRVVAVGTTSVRALEGAARDGGTMAGWTTLFIRPGHRFRVIDDLLTNFHLPGSSLMVMISALAGRERALAAYRRAIESEYRFYSYGDAMLIRHPER